jgi:hypothetical protein
LTITAARGEIVSSVLWEDAGVLIGGAHVEAVVADAGDQLQPARDADLVLRIGRLDIDAIGTEGIRRCHTISVGPGGVMDEVDRAEERRVERIAKRRVPAGRGKNAGVAQIEADLGVELGAERDGVADRTGRRLVDEVALVERAIAIGDVVIGVVVEGAVGGDRTAGIDVLVATVEVGEHGRVLGRETASEIMLDDDRARIGGRPRWCFRTGCRKRP